MQLNSLEIKGFKSFGDRIVVNFDAGITGIVGPNGCGKSNIVDAIRWVLGEQKTKALRSEKMENVIFNGTSSRKPLQMAEVSLTFTNTKNILPTEFTQVTITRRYYRGGESEYLLNGVPCRLKDITNLFLDTGIGSDSYAIIELKMVDDLLNDRENSRRGLFEEAAGISKFKLRKKETFRKLEDTDKDLERVEDLLFEINRNMKLLEKQARQAEQYFKIKEEYKVASLELAKATIWKHAVLERQWQQRLTEAKATRSSLAAALSGKEAEVEKLKASLLEREKLLAGRQKTLNDKANAIRNYESEKKLKDERMRFLSERSNGLSRAVQGDEQQIASLTQAIDQLQAQVTSLQQQQAGYEMALAAARQVYEQAKTSTAATQEEAGQAARELRAQQDRVHQITKSIELNELQLKTLESELLKHQTDASRQSASLAEFEAKMQVLDQQLAEKQSQMQGLVATEKELAQKLETNQQETEQIREQVTAMQREYDAKQHEYNLTKSLVENLEGFPEAIRFLKKNTDWYQNAPLVSDVITCPEQYRVAIESYLEPYMNYYVVDNDMQALQGIALLAKSSRGRANFFVLDRFAEFKPASAKNLDNAVRALDIAEFDARFTHLVNWLLDDVYISLDNQVPADAPAVLLAANGMVSKRRNSFSGGSVGIFEGKRIGRARNLEKLSKETATLQMQIRQQREKLGKLQQDQIALKQANPKQQIDNLFRLINQQQQERVALMSKSEQLSSFINSAGNRQQDIGKRIYELQQELENLQPQAEAARQDLRQLEQTAAQAQGKQSAAAEELNRLSTAFNQHNVQFLQHQNLVNSKTQDLGYKQGELTGLQKRIERNRQELKNTENEIRGLLDKAVIKDDELLALYEEKESIEKGVNEAEREYYEARAGIDRLEKEAREIQRQREATEAEVQNVQQQVNDSKLTLTAITQRIAVEFEVDLDEEALADYEGRDGAEEELRVKVQQIKNRIEKIGPINPMAMEAYKEIEERFNFITQQKNDLLEAKKSLVQTISEIDAVAKENFLNTFNQIRANFQMVFRSLFTEQDSCDLILTNPDDPLDSPIDIIARPKGKRPLTINQLSGGEKTLTAISLLFSIYLIKPAPFCIFDEVDAPLDDANIDKFNNIIRKFSADSQFIIVTHNKRTMASTDTMYGITMLEQGVSKVIPVDLRQLNHA